MPVATPRQSPASKSIVRTQPKALLQNLGSVADTSGMDPEMQATLNQDLARRNKIKAVTTPAAAGVGGFGAMLQGLFGKKKKAVPNAKNR